MADLREQLRRIEAADPPNLWAAIESRAREERPQMDANIASVVAFRGRGSEVRRRVAAGLVAAAVFALTIIVAWRAIRDVPIEPIPPGDQLPAGWVRCTNSALGYSIGYPGSWNTTDILLGEQDPAYACRWFSPDPFGPQGNEVTEGWGYPLEVGIGGTFDRELGNKLDPEVARIIVQEEQVVDGHRAVRLEFEMLFDPVGEPGLHYEYLVELDPETTLIVHTTATRGIVGVYEENRIVVDQAVDTLRFAVAAPAALPTGWVRCANEVLGYSIGYPGEWHTTDVLIGEQDPAYACQWFSPEPFGPEGNVVMEGWGYPLEAAIRGPFDQQLQQELDPGVVRVLLQQDLVVDGHRAVRLEYETLVDLIADTGLHYEYLIELDPETTLIVHTTETRGIAVDYDKKKVVVDQAVDTLRFS